MRTWMQHAHHSQALNTAQEVPQPQTLANPGVHLEVIIVTWWKWTHPVRVEEVTLSSPPPPPPVSPQLFQRPAVCLLENQICDWIPSGDDHCSADYPNSRCCGSLFLMGWSSGFHNMLYDIYSPRCVWRDKPLPESWQLTGSYCYPYPNAYYSWFEVIQ